MLGNKENNNRITDDGDLTEEDIGNIITIISTDGYYKQATIVKVVPRLRGGVSGRKDMQAVS